MLPREKRVGKNLFPEVMKKGKQFSYGHFSFRYKTEKDLPGVKFSFVVSSSVSRKANQRNRIKRRGYAIIRRNEGKIKSVPVIGVFFAKKGAAGISYADMNEEITHILKQTKITH